MIDSITADIISLPSMHQRRVMGIAPARLAYLYNAIKRQQSWLFASGVRLSEAIKELSSKEEVTQDEAVAILQVFGAIEREVKPLKN